MPACHFAGAGSLGPPESTSQHEQRSPAAAGDPIVSAFGLPALVAPAPGPLRLKLNKTRAPCLARSKKAQGSAAAHNMIKGYVALLFTPTGSRQARPHHRAWCVMPRSSPPRHFTSSVHADVECSRLPTAYNEAGSTATAAQTACLIRSTSLCRAAGVPPVVVYSWPVFRSAKNG